MTRTCEFDTKQALSMSPRLSTHGYYPLEDAQIGIDSWKRQAIRRPSTHSMSIRPHLSDRRLIIPQSIENMVVELSE